MNVQKSRSILTKSLLFVLTILPSVWSGAYAQHSGLTCRECCVVYSDELSECTSQLSDCTSTVTDITRFGLNSPTCTSPGK